MLKGIRGRILSQYLFLILVSMVLLGIAIIFPLKNYFLTGLKEDMLYRAELVNRLIKIPLIKDDFSAIDKEVKNVGEKIGTRITIILPDGQVIAESDYNPDIMENHNNRPEIKEAFLGENGYQVRYSETLKEKMMYVAVPIMYSDKIVAVSRLALPVTNVEKALAKMRSILYSGIILAAFITFLISIKISRELTDPIEKINKGAQKIAGGNLEARIYTEGKDELGELGKTINYMTETIKEKIEEILEEKSRLENLLNTVASGVIVLDINGLVSIINPTAEEMFNINKIFAVGKHNLEVIRNYGLNETIEKCLKEEKVVEYEFTTISQNEKILKTYLAPVFGENKVTGITMVFHDITNLRRLEQMRADFVANASHELRTPLTNIKGYAETLLNGGLEDKSINIKFLNIIDKEADRLINLIGELLTLSQIESKKHTANDLEETDILFIIKKVTEEFNFRYQAKNISLECNLPEKLATIKVNPEQIKQVLINLLDNALKYTPDGGKVWVEANEDIESVTIKVNDTGYGIPEKDMMRVFERFYRIDKARTRKLGGFGLGLSIVKNIIEAHGGRIGVDSKLNEGSSFWFKLPKN